MATARIEQPDMVSLNGHLFRIKGQVIRQIANRFAEKTVIGDFTEQSDPVLSQITWRDLSGGQGRYIIHPDEQNDAHFHEFWTGNIRNELPGHIIPGPGRPAESLQMADSVGADSTLYPVYWAYGKHAGNVSPGLYAINTDGSTNHNFVRESTWHRSLPSTPRELKIGRIGNKEAFVIAESSTVEWGFSSTILSSSGASSNWHGDTSIPMKSIAFWRGLLWGISSDGALYFSGEETDTGSLNWVNTTKVFSADSGTIRSLTTGALSIPTKEDNEHLILVRNDGFDIYDRLTEEFERTFPLPPADYAGHGGMAWQGAFYYPYGMSLWQWTPQDRGAIATDVGLTYGDGMPDKFAGHIFDVKATPRQLFVSVFTVADDTSFVDAVYGRSATTGWTRMADMEQQAGQSVSSRNLLYPMYVGPQRRNNDSLENVLIPGWQHLSNQQVEVRSLSNGRLNITNDSVTNRLQMFGEAELVTPWVLADGNQDWTAHKLSVEVSHLSGSINSSGSMFNLDYATDFNDSGWKTGISVGPNPVLEEGRFEVSLPNNAAPIGLPFTSMRLRARWANSDNNAYDLHRVSLTFQKKPKLRYAFSFEIDLRGGDAKQPSGSVRQTRQWLDEFYEQSTLAEFAYFDEHPGGSRTYFVTALQPQASEETGHSPEGTVQMTVMEVV